MNVQLLDKYEKECGYVLIEVKDGKVMRLMDNSIIPVDQMAHHTIPKDGFYALTETTCNGQCSIGHPREQCKKAGIYLANECSLYSVLSLEKVNLTASDIIKVLEDKVVA